MGDRGFDMDRIAEPDPVVERRVTAAPAGYEPPHVEVLGTFAELTRGSQETLSDGLGNGSAL